MGTSAKSTASESMDSVTSRQSAKIRAAIIAKKRIEGSLEKKKRLASMINRRSFLRKCGSSKSMEASLDSMEMGLNEFERGIGREILGAPEKKGDGKSSSFSFDLAGRKRGQKKNEDNEMENRDIHSEASPYDEHKSTSVQTVGSMSHGAITRKVSNVAPTTRMVSNFHMASDLPEMGATSSDDSESSDSDDDDDDESHNSNNNIEEEEGEFMLAPYQEPSELRWFDRFIRESEFCIGYACHLIECDPTDTYARKEPTLVAGAGEAEQGKVDDARKEKKQKPEEEKPKKRKWYQLPRSATIELKDADPALDELTDSDSWMSEDGEVVPLTPETKASKLLTSNPEEYFALIAASSKSVNRVADHHKQKKANLLPGGLDRIEI